MRDRKPLYVVGQVKTANFAKKLFTSYWLSLARDLVDGPLRVLSNQRFGIAGGAFEGWESFRAADVSECDADVSQKAAAFRAENGSPGESLAEGGFIQLEQFDEIGRGEVVVLVGLHHARFGGEAVPRAGG